MPLHSGKIWLNAQKYLFLQEIINLITNNMKKNFVKPRWLFTMLLFVTTMIMPTMMLAKESITPTRPEGEGTVENPYQIGTREELYWFARLVNGKLENEKKNTSANAILTDDIIVNTGVLDANKNLVSGKDFIPWTPIGKSVSDADAYTGTFDGKGYTISGLYIDKTSSYYVGLFGCIGANGKISNVGVLDSYFQFIADGGGVCGVNYGELQKCSNSSTVSGTGDNAQNVGGVCGYNSGTIKSCYNTASVSGQNSVGGVCGFNSGTIKSCYNTASVSGQYFVGGVCGQNSGVTSTITNCFNEGTVSGTGDSVGGVCGLSYGTIKSCYNTASVSGQYSVGGVCGYNYDGTITNCYYLSGTVPNGKGGIGGNDDESGKAVEMSIEQFKSGEVAWLLNGSTFTPAEGSTLAWYQKLGENADAYPVLKSTGHNTVYKASLFSCDGTTRIGEYANKQEGDKLSHNYQMAETADEGTSNLYSEECAICHTKDGTKYIKGFCGNKDNIIKLTAESDGSYKAAEPVDINDNAAYDSPVDFTAPTLNYTRTYLGADQWQAVYVPFETQATDWTGKDITVASINNFHEYEKKDGSGYETVLEVKKATSGAFEANTPYLLRTKDSGSKTITITNAKLHKASSETYYCMSMTRKYDFTGIYTRQSVLVQDESSVAVYALNKQGLIAPLNPSTEVGAQRWYLTVSNRNGSNMSQASKSRSINIDEVGEGATTAIKGIQVITNNEADNTSLNGIYDLQGRKLSKEPTHGIYIKNGKKYVK